MKIYTTPLKLYLFSITGILLFLVLFYKGVDNAITEEDKLFITKYLMSIPSLNHEPFYEDELEMIKKIQDSVLTVAPNNEAPAL